MGKDEDGNKLRCKKEFKTKSELFRHMRRGDHKSQLIKKPVEGEELQEYICQFEIGFDKVN